ncbi:MAG: helix-turn-helix transcriptional regulator [Clostridia bacterium]|nr:helix-turn-helix transcriptional regulator [Clostridia bacterium]
MADELGVKQQQYHLWEAGTNKLSAETLIALCKFYYLSADYILGLNDEPRPYK